MNRELTWQQNNQSVTMRWVSESAHSTPKKILLGDDTLKADEFYRQASQGAAYVYVGDFQNAKQLLQAVNRRVEKRSGISAKTQSTPDVFNRHRLAQAHRAQILSRLLICVESDFTIKLSRAPDVREAISEAHGPPSSGFVVSLRELLGYIGSYEWRKKGVFISALDSTIHPSYGLFSPLRGEYLDLVASAPLPTPLEQAFDIGTGTGVIAAILAKRGVPSIVATDLDPRAIACARENILRLGFEEQVNVVSTNLFPAQMTADLIVCNPPWLPARPTSNIERAIYDENSQMLKGFLGGVGAHLTEHGEAWLILSDLAEHLGLRKPDELQSLIKISNLKVAGALEAKPKHSKVQDENDPLYAARSKEVTKLWRLKKA